MEYGIFLPIANNGWIISKNSPQYMPSFELNKHVTLKAEQMGLDFVLSMVKFRGYGGETEHWDYAQDSFTLMSGLAAVTSKIDLYATVQPLTMHPAMVARMAATIDNISNGRFGINVVAGWNKYEYSQMGLWPGDQYYKERYELLDEWLSVVKGLWANGRLTHAGKNYQLEDCLCQPTPSKTPKIVCAGMSDTGLDFTVRNGDINFVAGTIEQITKVSKRAKEVAKKYGNPIKTYALYTLIIADTDTQAKAIEHHYIAGTDAESFDKLQEVRKNDTAGSTTTDLLGEIFIAPTLVGSPETIVDIFEHLENETDIDGLILTFPDYVEDFDYFEQNVLPLIKSRGLHKILATV